MNIYVKSILSITTVVSVLCVGISGCTEHKSMNVVLDASKESTPIINKTTLASTTASTTTTQIAKTTSVKTSSPTTTTKPKTTTNVKTTRSSSGSKATITTASYPSIITDNPYNTCYGAMNQQQYNVIHKNVESRALGYKSEESLIRSNYTADSFKKHFHVDITDKSCLKAIFAFDTALALGKGLGDDGLNAYIIFADIEGKSEGYHGSVARAAEALCHELGVNCKVADCPKANLAWIYVQLDDGKWYHYNGYSESGFVTDPEQIVKNGSTCKTFY